MSTHRKTTLSLSVIEIKYILQHTIVQNIFIFWGRNLIYFIIYSSTHRKIIGLNIYLVSASIANFSFCLYKYVFWFSSL